MTVSNKATSAAPTPIKMYFCGISEAFSESGFMLVVTGGSVGKPVVTL